MKNRDAIWDLFTQVDNDPNIPQQEKDELFVELVQEEEEK